MSRDGKNVYTGFVDHLCPGGAPKSAMSPVPVAFEVIERLTDPDGNRFAHPDHRSEHLLDELALRGDRSGRALPRHGTSPSSSTAN